MSKRPEYNPVTPFNPSPYGSGYGYGYSQTQPQYSSHSGGSIPDHARNRYQREEDQRRREREERMRMLNDPHSQDPRAYWMRHAQQQMAQITNSHPHYQYPPQSRHPDGRQLGPPFDPRGR